MMRFILFLIGIPIATALYCTVSLTAGSLNPALGGCVVVGLPMAALGLWLLNRRSVRNQAARMAQPHSGIHAAIVLALLAGTLALGTSTVTAQTAQPPETRVVQEDRGRDITIMAGFDLAEFGGDDSQCTRTELDAVALEEEVSSPDEACKWVLEWSLKNRDNTLYSGFYAGQPGEWFRLTYDQVNGEVRYVGTFWYLPKGWNAHMLAGNLAADWQVKNPDLITIVGLSPTDPWVQGLWQDAEGKFDAPAAALATPAPTKAAPTAQPTAVSPTPVPPVPPTDPDPVNPLVAFIQWMIVGWNDFWTWVF